MDILLTSILSIVFGPIVIMATLMATLMVGGFFMIIWWECVKFIADAVACVYEFWRDK